MTKQDFQKNFKQVSPTKWVKKSFISRNKDIFVLVFSCLATVATVLLMIACV